MIDMGKVPAMRVVNSLLGVGRSLFGSAEFPVRDTGKFPPSLCPE